MVRVYSWLIRLYPEDIRFAYGAEMVTGFEQGLADRRARPLGQSAWILGTIGQLLFEAAVERFQYTFYSHRSFHGRCKPDLGRVRPPNMGKREWYGLDEPLSPPESTAYGATEIERSRR